MHISPSKRANSIQKGYYRAHLEVSEVPYGLFNQSTERSRMSSRSTHKRLMSEDIKSLRTSGTHSSETYITGFKSEMQKALNFIKKPKKLDAIPRSPDKKTIAPIFRTLNSDELEVRNFINALFSKEHTQFRKISLTSETESIDLIAADKILQEARKIVKNGIRKKAMKLELGGIIEEFWIENISKETTVRWDIFEDNLLSYINFNMITTAGVLRKVNWQKFFTKLYTKSSKETQDSSLWIKLPCYDTTPAVFQKTISLADWSKLIITQELVFLLFSCIDEVPSIPIKKLTDIPFLYACGCRYRGQWSDNKRHGVGFLELCSKEIYDGIFTNGLFQDYGSISFPSCSYKGFFHKNKLNGFGKLNYPNNNYFEGVFEKSKLINGTLKWNDNKEYIGEFNNNNLEGKGRMISPSGELWEGMWLNGQLHGEGCQQSADGQVLKGVFIEGKLSSKGKLKTANYKYTGEFKDSIPDGRGKYIFNSGEVYKGCVIVGRIEGKGIMNYPNGDIYSGYFICGVPEGVGEIEYGAGGRYKGGFSQGKPSGKGRFDFMAGSKIQVYEGEVKEGRLEGYGEAFISGGAVYKGQWVDGRLEGAGSWEDMHIKYNGEFFNCTFDGFGELKIGIAYFSGFWSHGMPDGNGDAKDPLGNSYSGGFSQGVPTSRHKLSTEFLQLLSSFTNRLI